MDPRFRGDDNGSRGGRSRSGRRPCRPIRWATAILIFVVWVGCGKPATTNEAPPPPVVASASVDRAVATTGDVLTYTVSVEHADDVTVEIPEAGSEIAGFRIIDSGRESSEAAGPRAGRSDIGPRAGRSDIGPRAGRSVERRWYRLRADLVGSYVLPAVTVTWRRGEGAAETAATSEIFVEVKSVLPAADSPEGQAADIRDVKPLVRPKGTKLWLWLSGLAVAALSALAWFLLRRRRTSARHTPTRPAHELAFEALSRLRETDFDDLVALRRYYFEISEVVRAYVEARFAVNATDLTTEEILRRMAGVSELDPLAAERLRRFLLDTDQVKFAAHQPTEAEIAETYERALSFVEGTRPRPEPVEQKAA